MRILIDAPLLKVDLIIFLYNFFILYDAFFSKLR
jgi:hypothetical protein